ncbi:MAG: ChaN family lipoprotein [Magnetococcales bacterium]|nr:ChaN family lipoprotein [Magnetococcales bacterium]
MIFLPLFLGLALLQWGVMGVIPIDINELMHLSDQSRLTEAQLIERLAAHRIVLIGESHDNPAHHGVQLRVIRALRARHPEMVVAMEMFPRTMQPELDRWVAGELSEEAFLDAVEWYFTWGFDFELYGPILRYARDERLPLLAMNLPREIVSRVRKTGLAALEPSIRDTLPSITPASTPYRIRLEEVFNSHPMMSKGGPFDSFVEAQTLWDGVMADSIQRWRAAHPHGVVVGLAGSGHLLMGHGIPHQLRARGVTDLVTLLPWTGSDSWIDPEAADYAWGTPEAPESPPPVRLGVILDEQRRDGAWVTGIQEESPAARAGLKSGDRLLRLNGREISTRHALVRLLQGVSQGSPVRLQREREGRTAEIELPMATSPSP